MRVIEAARRWAANAYAGCNDWPQAYRVVFAIWALSVYLPRNLWLAQLPDTFFVPPPSLAYFTDGFPPEIFLLGVNIIAVMAAVMLLFGKHVVTASIMYSAALMLGNTWGYSTGKIDHDILAVVTPLLLARYWADAPGVPGRKSAASWPLALLALVVGLGLSTAAAAKATTDWLDPSTQAVYSKLAFNHWVVGRETIASGFALEMGTPAVWEAVDYATILVEGAFVIALFNSTAFRFVLSMACLLHAGIFVLMRISYTSNLVVYAAFVDWSLLRNRVNQRSRSHIPGPVARFQRREAALYLAALALALLYVSVGNPVQMLQSALGVSWALEALITAVAALVSLAYLTRQLFHASARRSKKTRLIPDPTHDEQPGNPILLFDGDCGLCSRWVTLVRRFATPERTIEVLPLMSDRGRHLLDAVGLPSDYQQSIVLVDRRGAWVESTAVMRLFWHCGLPLAAVSPLMALVPAALRDMGYRFVARRRLALFGPATCDIPEHRLEG